MTPTEINALSCRELDAAVAEHVMGWTVCKSYLTGTYYDRGGELSMDWEWSAATDISAAFEVVEKMRDRGWYAVLCAGEISGWHCFLSDAEMHSGLKSHRVYAADLPNAICRAALIAHFTEKGGEG